MIEIAELDSIINEVRSELRSIFIKRRELIEKLGFAFEKVVANKESICEEIKNCLKEEIASDIISPRTIEQHCRSEWKKKTRPKHENEKISFSQRKPEEEEQRQKEVIIDNHGNPVQDAAENHYSDSSQKVDFRPDEKDTTHQNDELLDRLHRTLRELIYENKKIIQEKDEIQVKLGEALESLDVHKQRENELLRKRESTDNRLEQQFEAEFSMDYKLLQNHMAKIYKTTAIQEVWITVMIDVNKKQVVSARIGSKLVPQDVTESGNSYE